jgi:hypothetical protein
MFLYNVKLGGVFMNSFIGWVEILAVVKEYKLGNTTVRIHDYFYCISQ